MALLKRDHGIEVKSASSTIEEVVAREFVSRMARKRGINVPSNASFADTPAAAKGKKPGGKAPEPAKPTAPALPPPRLVKSREAAGGISLRRRPLPKRCWCRHRQPARGVRAGAGAHRAGAGDRGGARAARARRCASSRSRSRPLPRRRREPSRDAPNAKSPRCSRRRAAPAPPRRRRADRRYAAADRAHRAANIAAARRGSAHRSGTARSPRRPMLVRPPVPQPSTTSQAPTGNLSRPARPTARRTRRSGRPAAPRPGGGLPPRPGSSDGRPAAAAVAAGPSAVPPRPGMPATGRRCIIGRAASVLARAATAVRVCSRRRRCGAAAAGHPHHHAC